MRLFSFLAFALILVATLPTQAKNARVAHCQANRDPFTPDRCTPSRGTQVSCSISIQSGAQSALITVSLNNVLSASSPVTKAYQMSGTKNGWVARFHLNFGGLNRGMGQLLLNSNKEIMGILALEVYVNHDSSGNTYSKYTCGKTRESL